MLNWTKEAAYNLFYRKSVKSWEFPSGDPEGKPLLVPVFGQWFNLKQEAGTKVPFSQYHWLVHSVV